MRVILCVGCGGPLSICLISDVTSGITRDYIYASEYLNVLHSYSAELRDTGRYGFVLPPDQIDDSGTETYECLKVVMDAVRNA